VAAHEALGRQVYPVDQVVAVLVAIVLVRIEFLLQEGNLFDVSQGSTTFRRDHGRPEMLAGAIVLESDALARNFQAGLKLRDSYLVEIAPLDTREEMFGPGGDELHAVTLVDGHTASAHVSIEQVGGQRGQRHGWGNSIVAGEGTDSNS